MKREKLCLNAEQSYELQGLGINMEDSEFCLVVDDEDYTTIESRDTAFEMFGDCNIIPTYTLQEILGKLPKEIVKEENAYELCISCENDKYEVCYAEFATLESVKKENPLDAAYDMLCWVVKNGYYKEEKV